MTTDARDLRVVVADDERPARHFLLDLLRQCPGVAVAGEAASGDDAVALIARERPDLALLDLQMPDGSGLDVVRRLPQGDLPLFAFVTAYDDRAVEAFELNAIDYVLKPVQPARLAATVERARERLRHGEPSQLRASAIAAAGEDLLVPRRSRLERIPVRLRDEILLVPVRQITSIVADGELLHMGTVEGARYTITHRLRALEARLDPRRFVRLGRGTLVNVDRITRVTPMPGGTYLVTLSTGEEHTVSRIQSRLLRDTLLTL